MLKNVVVVLILLATGYAVLVIMGVLHQQPEVDRMPAPHRAAPKTKPKKPAPKDDRFTIISDVPEPAIKRTIVVRLHRELSEKELREIVDRVRGKDRRPFKRTFISYYLPGMDLGAGAWATTHCDIYGIADVRILGHTTTEKAPAPKRPSEILIGKWIDRRPYMGPITIYKKDGKLYLDQRFRDGSQRKKEIVESTSPLGRRFDQKGGNSHGDHFIIQADGDLQIRDREGLIAVARKAGK